MASKDNVITDLAKDVAGDAARASRSAKAAASDLIVEVKDDAAVMAKKAGASALSAAGQGKTMAADAVHGLADAARQMASKLEDGKPDSSNTKAAEYARKAADGMDRFSSTLRDKEIEEIADNARDAVRQNPAIAIGAAALIGFALARFLKGNGSGDRDA